MGITSRGGKQTIDPLRSSVVEDDMRKDEEVVETSEEMVEKTVKETEVPQQMVPIARPPPPFPYRLVNNTEMVNIGVLSLC